MTIGRPTIYQTAMTPAERQRRSRTIRRKRAKREARETAAEQAQAKQAAAEAERLEFQMYDRPHDQALLFHLHWKLDDLDELVSRFPPEQVQADIELLPLIERTIAWLERWHKLVQRVG